MRVAAQVYAPAGPQEFIGYEHAGEVAERDESDRTERAGQEYAPCDGALERCAM